jgi:hypothetical protein
MVSPQKIKYNGVSSADLNPLDVILDVAFDSDNGAMSSYLNRSAVASESHDGRYKSTTRYKYDELFSPQFTIVKKDFSDFTQDEVRQVLKYLTSTDKPSLLEVYYDGDSNIVDWACIGGFVSIEMYKIANNRTVGILAKFEAITPFAMSGIYTFTKTISDSTDNKITIEIDTDDNKPVYPRVTVKHLGSVVRIPDGKTLTYLSDMAENTAYFNGATYYWKTADSTDPAYFHSSTTNPNLATTSVKLTNKHTDFFKQSTVLEPTIVKNNNTTEIVTIDGANKVISSNSANRIFDTDFVDWNWLALLDGKNEIVVEGNCTVTIEYREPRKIGEF